MMSLMDPFRCIRPSRGYDMSEICERCRTTGIECITVKRRVGRQPGVKNRKRKADAIDEQAGASSTSNNEAQVSRDVDHLPNPLHVLASEAIRRHSTPEYAVKSVIHLIYSSLTELLTGQKRRRLRITPIHAAARVSSIGTQIGPIRFSRRGGRRRSCVDLIHYYYQRSP